MGAFRAQLQTTSHSEPISLTRRIALIVIYSRSRIPPPLWDLNLGKLCYLIPVNRPPSPMSLNTHCEDPSMEYSSVIPRQGVTHVGSTILGFAEGVRVRRGSGMPGSVFTSVDRGVLANGLR